MPVEDNMSSEAILDRDLIRRFMQRTNATSFEHHISTWKPIVYEFTVCSTLDLYRFIHVVIRLQTPGDHWTSQIKVSKHHSLLAHSVILHSSVISSLRLCSKDYCGEVLKTTKSTYPHHVPNERNT